MKVKLLTIVLAFAALAVLAFMPAWAQDSEPEPGKDHSLLSRMPNFVITAYESNFDEMVVPLPDDKMERIEGQRTQITYDLKEGAENPSILQIIRNYTRAVAKLGGKVVFEGDHVEFGGRVACMKLDRGGQQIWVVVEAYAEGHAYRLGIVQVGEMTQDVAGGDLRQTLEQRGRVTVRINFDTGKATIKPDSFATLDKIAKMMKEAPALKVRVEGHTDDTGQAGANLRLSLERATSVSEALIQRGVAPQRLAVAGFGQAQPLADNSSEQGRARNRRVELVKM